MAFSFARRSAIALAILSIAGCTVHNREVPALSGPSALALTLTLNANPASINQNGGDQSKIEVFAFGPDGQRVARALRVDMFVDGVAQDFGFLSARSIVTKTDGTAPPLSYTAPPSPPNGQFGTCRNLPGNCVEIVATPTDNSNFVTSQSEGVTIRLVPPGVFLGPGPTPDFTVTPNPPAANSPVQFDASSSCGGPLSGSGCPGTRSITQYSWNFGDGTTATGVAVTHSFARQQAYSVTLTVTNDLGTSASKAQLVTVGIGVLPTPLFSVSPSSPIPLQEVFFNASASTAGPGHSIVSYRWSLGDGATDAGVVVSHDYGVAGAYVVQLTVTDEVGQSNTSSGTTVTVTLLPPPPPPTPPVASFTIGSPSPRTPTTVITFDGNASTGSSLTYTWNFGDGIIEGPFASPIRTHTYAAAGAGAYPVTLRVTDGITGLSNTSAAQTVTIVP